MDTSLIWNSCDILSRIRKKEKTSSWRRYDRCHHPVHPPFFFTSPPPAYHTRKDEDSPFYSYSESSIPSLTAAIQHDSSLDAFPTRVYRFRKSRDALQLPPLSFVSPCSCVWLKVRGGHDPWDESMSLRCVFREMYSILVYGFVYGFLSLNFNLDRLKICKISIHIFRYYWYFVRTGLQFFLLSSNFNLDRLKICKISIQIISFKFG